MSAKVPRQAVRSSRKIMLVDDHPLMREGIGQCISRQDDLELCGQAESAAEALRVVERLKPDLVLVDLSLPGRSGLELIKDLKALYPDLPVLVLSMHDESLYASRALRAGARGYLMKRAGSDRLLEAIRAVLSGRIVVSPEMGTRLLEERFGQAGRSSRGVFSHLTDRQYEVFQLLGEAKTNREIAEQLHLSPKTVETHRLTLMDKLKVKTSAELLRLAIQYAEKDVAGNPEAHDPA